MNREYVESSMITSIGYDAEACLLEVEFKEFPEYMWYEFRTAESIGKYFNANIRKQFTPLGYRV